MKQVEADVVIVGAGTAGLPAAVAAAEWQSIIIAKTLLISQHPLLVEGQQHVQENQELYSL